MFYLNRASERIGQTNSLNRCFCSGLCIWHTWHELTYYQMCCFNPCHKNPGTSLLYFFSKIYYGHLITDENGSVRVFQKKPCLGLETSYSGTLELAFPPTVSRKILCRFTSVLWNWDTGQCIRIFEVNTRPMKTFKLKLLKFLYTPAPFSLASEMMSWYTKGRWYLNSLNSTVLATASATRVVCFELPKGVQMILYHRVAETLISWHHVRKLQHLFHS